jgi:putative redox protein
MTSTVIYEGDLRTVATHLHSGNKIETDAPTDNMGKGERFSPSDLVATALGSCMATIMGIKAGDLGLDLTGMQIDIQKIMKADPRRISGIEAIFHFPEDLQTDNKQRIILERAALTCPVAQSINPEIELKVEFNWTKKELVKEL